MSISSAKRILITGLSSVWGGRLAQQLERAPGIEVLVGVDTSEPRHELQRTEFVRVGSDDALLRRIIRAARIDTIVDTRLVADVPALAGRRVPELNVTGTRAVLAAAAGRDSPVRRLVFKSSALVYGAGSGDPAFFTEDLTRTGPPRGPIERSIVEAERAVHGFISENRGVTVTVLRPATEIGGEARSAHAALLGLPVVPSILGFDPRWQFAHEDDVIGALAHAVTHELPGAFNVAGDGVLALSEVVSLLGKALVPVLPPWGTLFAAVQLRRLGLRMPIELLGDLRYGRGLDNRRLKASGYTFRYTSREAVLKLRAQQRLRPLLGRGDDRYHYEREVEDFLRWSPSVQRQIAAESGRHDELGEPELLGIIPSMETETLERLRVHEAEGPARPRILQEIDHQLALRASLGSG